MRSGTDVDQGGRGAAFSLPVHSKGGFSRVKVIALLPLEVPSLQICQFVDLVFSPGQCHVRTGLD